MPQRTDDRLRWRSVRMNRRSRSSRRRRPSPWYIDWFDDPGKRRTLYFPTKEACERARALKEQEINSWLRPLDPVTWPQLVQNYSASAKMASASASHAAKVAKVCERFGDLCAPLRSDYITPLMCDRFFAQRAAGLPAVARQPNEAPKPKIPSPVTVRVEYAMLHAMFEWAAKQGYMAGNPLNQIERPPRRAPQTQEGNGQTVSQVWPQPQSQCCRCRGNLATGLFAALGIRDVDVAGLHGDIEATIEHEPSPLLGCRKPIRNAPAS